MPTDIARVSVYFKESQSEQIVCTCQLASRGSSCDLTVVSAVVLLINFVFFFTSLGLMEWSNEKVLNLIELYRDRPVLWDCRLKEYKDRNKKMDAILEIAVSFGVEKEEIERKIKIKINSICSDY
jgi:hypothetical protein